ncbi:MAG: hypothetical protein ACK5FE_06675 [Cyanobacteriota bacterium]|jgi:hypothetical protein
MTLWNAAFANNSGLPGSTTGLGSGVEDGIDAVEAYFQCITTCSLDDGECITECTEVLRSTH